MVVGHDSAIGSDAGESRPRLLGIWRLGTVLHASSTAEVLLAQPADSADNPRWDYVVKRAVGPQLDIEGRRQIARYIAACSAAAHPNLVALLDGSASGRSPYVVMPRMEGDTMEDQFRRYQAQPLPVALWMIRQAAQALTALHGAGWVHGDVKPSNVMISPRGHATLIDLNFASRANIPFGPIFRGTPEFAAPELLAGEVAALPAMDVFSLGRMLWKSLTNMEPTPPAMLEPVAELVERMVAADIRLRPTAASLSKELLRLEIETLGCHLGPLPADRHAA